MAPQRLLLEAQDTPGLSALLQLTVDLYRHPLEPCHVFTLTTQLSLHSILLHHHMVELLLIRLSDFLTATAGTISLGGVNDTGIYCCCVHSLCGKGQCQYKNIMNMWLAMSSLYESVNPAFREDMLPEFPVIKL